MPGILDGRDPALTRLGRVLAPRREGSGRAPLGLHDVTELSLAGLQDTLLLGGLDGEFDLDGGAPAVRVGVLAVGDVDVRGRPGRPRTADPVAVVDPLTAEAGIPRDLRRAQVMIPSLVENLGPTEGTAGEC